MKESENFLTTYLPFCLQPTLYHFIKERPSDGGKEDEFFFGFEMKRIFFAVHIVLLIRFVYVIAYAKKEIHFSKKILMKILSLWWEEKSSFEFFLVEGIKCM